MTEGVGLSTAIIGVGNIGSTLARLLTNSNERAIVAANEETHAQALAVELGPLADAASVEEAIRASDVVVFAVWLDTTRQLISKHSRLLDGKVVVDPSNPIAFDEGGKLFRTLPDDRSAADDISALLPRGAHYVKALGTLSAPSLASGANREPRAVLFYATDDEAAAETAEWLIRAIGFEPLQAGGFADAKRLEAPDGDLHQGALNGELVDLKQARAAIAARKGNA